MLQKPPSSYAGGFHTKAFFWRGLYVLGNDDVPDEAVYRAAELVFNSLSGVNSGLIAKLQQYLTRFAVVPYGTEITDLPDYDDLDSSWSGYRGLGGVIGRPTSSSGEENLLPTHPNDPYHHEESIGLHEWFHAIEGIGLKSWNPDLHDQFVDAYENALSNGLWTNTYAAETFAEYFAETAQAFFDDNPERTSADGVHNSINTRAELKIYDPTVYNLHLQLFGNSPWTVGKFYGSASANSLTGTTGADLIFGNGGSDSLKGGSGADYLLGGSSSDRLDGGSGKDTLNGGPSSDTFVFSAALGSSNIDAIADFKHDYDRIGLDDAKFGAIGSSLTSSEFLSKSGATKAADSTDHIIYDRSTGRLYYDSDSAGGKASVHFATLTNKPTLDTGDFVIV